MKAIFRTIVSNAVRLCEASFAFVMVCRGERLRLAARTKCSRAFAVYLQGGIALDRTTTTGRAALRRAPVQVADFQAERGMVATPAHGTIAVWRHEVRPFSPGQVRLLEGFAQQAAIALANQQLLPYVRVYCYKRVGGEVNDFHAINLLKFSA